MQVRPTAQNASASTRHAGSDPEHRGTSPTPTATSTADQHTHAATAAKAQPAATATVEHTHHPRPDDDAHRIAHRGHGDGYPGPGGYPTNGRSTTAHDPALDSFFKRDCPCPGTVMEGRLCLFRRLIVRKQCVMCDQPFEAKRSAAKYCGERCKKRAQRAPADASNVVSLGRDDVGGGGTGLVESATRTELEAVGRLDTALGRAALAIAARLDAAGAGETGAGFRALVDGHRAALAEAMRDAEREQDAVETIRASAALKLVSSG